MLWRQELGRILTDLDGLLDDDELLRAQAGRRQVRSELVFGMRGAPVVEVSLPGGRAIGLRGSADRVDLSADGTVVVSDYKSGKAEAIQGPGPGPTPTAAGQAAAAGVRLRRPGGAGPAGRTGARRVLVPARGPRQTDTSADAAGRAAPTPRPWPHRGRRRGRGLYPHRTRRPDRWTPPWSAASATPTGSALASGGQQWEAQARRSRRWPRTRSPTPTPPRRPPPRRSVSDGAQRTAARSGSPPTSTPRCSSRPGPARARPRRWWAGSWPSSLDARGASCGTSPPSRSPRRPGPSCGTGCGPRSKRAALRRRPSRPRPTARGAGPRRARRRRHRHAARLRPAHPHRAPGRGRAAAAGRGARRGVSGVAFDGAGPALAAELLDDPGLERRCSCWPRRRRPPRRTCARWPGLRPRSWDLLGRPDPRRRPPGRCPARRRSDRRRLRGGSPPSTEHCTDGDGQAPAPARPG